MKTLIFSDTHLTHRFERNKYKFLEKIISEHDRVIINGDFWDSWLTNFDSFIRSKWNRIFRLLQEKNTIYIHGDHDPSSVCDERTNLFATESHDSYIYEPTNQQRRIYIEHGHNLVKNRREIYVELFFKIQNEILNSRFKNLWGNLVTYTGAIAHRIFSPKIFAESLIAKNLNKQTKHNITQKLFYLCGDSHYPEIDLRNNYANCDCIQYSYASYLSINQGELSLHKCQY